MANGAKVLARRKEAEGDKTTEMIRAACGEGLFVKADVSKVSKVETLIKSVWLCLECEIQQMLKQQGSRAIVNMPPIIRMGWLGRSSGLQRR